jgi:hypothetical protein
MELDGNNDIKISRFNCNCIFLTSVFGSTLQVELDQNKGCLREYKTASDRKVEAPTDMIDYVNENQIPGDSITYSDVHAAIARVTHPGTGSG